MSLLAQVFWRLLNISLLGGIFVLLVVLLRKIFRRSTRGVFLILWMLLAVRLLFPFMIEAPFGVLSGKEFIKTELFTESKEESASAAKSGMETFHGGENIPKENDLLQGNDNPATAESILPETGEKTPVPGGMNEAVEKTEGIGSADAETVVSTILKVATVVWLAGFVCLLLYALWHGIRLYRMTRIHVVREDGVWVVDEVTTPFVYGIFRPRIVLPSSLPAEKEPFVLAHERASSPWRRFVETFRVFITFSLLV